MPSTLSVGNVVGVLTIVPLFFVAKPVSGWLRYFAGFTLFHWISTLAILLTSFIVFGLQDTDKFKFFYLVFLPVLVFAIRDGFMGAAYSILLSDTAMIAILLWRVSEPAIATELQVLMISLSATGLVLGATISERRRISLELEESHARLRDSQAALLQASRLSLASEMAAALAHEMNQPLSSIRSFIRAARRKLDKGRVMRADLKSDIDAAVKEVDVAASLIRETRKFLERGDVTKEKLNLRQLLLTCSDLIGPELSASRISWDLRLPEKLPQVMGNATQIQQVVLNLVRNAKESILEGRGKTRSIRLDVSLDSRPGYAEIAVSDSGPGIPPEVKAMLFKPLKSSKDNGLGLGLSLSNTIVTSHGGSIWYDETVSSGARFAFTLPLSGNLERVQVKHSVLIVDDEQSVRESLSSVLATYGFKTASCGNAPRSDGTDTEIGSGLRCAGCAHAGHGWLEPAAHAGPNRRWPPGDHDNRPRRYFDGGAGHAERRLRFYRKAG